MTLKTKRIIGYVGVGVMFTLLVGISLINPAFAEETIFSKGEKLISDLTNSIKTIAFAGAVLAFVVCGCGYIISTTPQEAQKWKSYGIKICIGLLLIGSATIIVDTIRNL